MIHRKNERGSIFIEFALITPLLLLLMFGVFDFSKFYFTQLTLQHALREAGRYAVAGNHFGTGVNRLTRLASIKKVAQDAAAGMDLSAIQITPRRGTNPAGGPSDTVTISLTTNVKFITPVIRAFFKGGGSQITVSTTFKNEPFDPRNAI